MRESLAVLSDAPSVAGRLVFGSTLAVWTGTTPEQLPAVVCARDAVADC